MSGGPLDLVLLVCACLGLAAAAVCLAALRRANSLVEHPELNGQASWLRFVPVTSRLLKKIEESSRRRQQAESDNETRYKILTENVPAAVMLHQSDGMVLWGSPFTEVLTGFSLSEVLKNRESFLLGQVHEEDKRLVEKSLAIVKTGEPFQYRYRFYHKSGMTLWLETRTVPIYDSSLNDYIALSITLDVTSAVLNQLQIEERNRDLNEFTYMVSHDLKNPINTIKGMIGILQAEPSIKKTRALEQAAAYITSAAVRLEDLTDGVLMLARVSASERTLEPVNLNDVLEEVVLDFQHQLERAEGTITTVEELPFVLGNRTQLYQIFSNLIGNAIKYRAPDRPLMISVAPERGNLRRRAAIVVSDNGRGIAPEHLDEIFKPFHRAGDSSVGGLGVGLACVQRLASRLGGTVGVESTQGAGSTFTVTLRKSPNS